MMGLINAIYSGIKAASREAKPAEWKYKDLESTPYLYGSEYLNELYAGAREEWQEDAVHDHMVRYDVIDKKCEGYDRLDRRHKRTLRRRVEDA